MDFLASLGQTPLSAIVPYVTAAIAIATILLNMMPPPGSGGSSVYAMIWNFVHVVANLRSPPATPSTAAPAASATMLPGWLVGLMLAATLAACTSQQEQQAVQFLQVACDVDGVVQPAVVPLAKLAGADGATIANVDDLLVHPAVAEACAKLNGRPAPAFPAGGLGAAAPK